MTDKEYYKVRYWGNGLGDYMITVSECMFANDNDKKEELNLLVPWDFKKLKSGLNIEKAENFILNFFDTNIKKINYINDNSITATPIISKGKIKCKYSFTKADSKYFCYSFVSFYSPLIPEQLRSKFVSICQANNIELVCVDYPMPLFDAINLINKSVGLFSANTGISVVSRFCGCPMAIYVPIPPVKYCEISKNDKLRTAFSTLDDMHIIETMIKNARARIT